MGAIEDGPKRQDLIDIWAEMGSRSLTFERVSSLISEVRGVKLHMGLVADKGSFVEVVGSWEVSFTDELQDAKGVV